MSPSQDLFETYHGQIVPQNYNAGFVALSYVVSLVGAASTLELINRRTGFKGLFNNLLLVSSAITMGGISIWCMHFIGNRAIDIADGQAELQVAYSSGFTAISFFVPILVLLAAFISVGTNSRVSWWRLCVGGLLCGTAVCGMHYLGNASIANYVCVYRASYVIGSAIIAVVASIVALAMFFVFRAAWASSWWKRAISAVILAGAVSGMHWCAAVGTRYRLTKMKPEGNEPSRTATVIVVICLSLAACFIIAGSAILRARSMRKTALRAQQITLGTAIFDKDGRILVNNDGIIPSTVVTDSFLEKHSKEGFNIGHPSFHWMFHASRNWNSVSSLISGMRHHLSLLPRSGRDRDGRHGIQLINEHGELIHNYDVIFRELFCLAASALSDRLRDPITSVGVLWDEILPTGAIGKRARTQLQKNMSRKSSTDHGSLAENHGGDVEKGTHLWDQEYARGSLMFLVRRVETDRDAEKYVSAGYRFAETQQVSGIIRTSMQIKSPGFEQKLRDMATYTTRQQQSHAGVQLGFFAIRARPNSLGFEIMVRKAARQMLPSVALPILSLRAWHIQFLRRFEHMKVSEILRILTGQETISQNPKEENFAGQFAESIQRLRDWTQEPLFDEATLTTTVVELPSREDESSGQPCMIAMRLMIPIHSSLSSPTCEFVPLSFFKMHQVPAKFGQEFTRGIHEEFGSIIKKSAANADVPEDRGFNLFSKFRPSGSTNASVGDGSASSNSKMGRRESIPDSVRTSSTINLYQPENMDRARSVDYGDEHYAGRGDLTPVRPSYGGIMVFQEIKIDIEDDSRKSNGAHLTKNESLEAVAVESAGSNMSNMGAGIEMQSIRHLGTNVQVGPTESSHGEGALPGDVSQVVSFVDVLFSECMESR
ncbi:hypothetical protein BGZ63DRAFT_427961 [Mariannaea sp. PMI_226]|nr:hypothetical protein BGZ63DRAFT_427961 [Mariannaea sp. PMI_226]